MVQEKSGGMREEMAPPLVPQNRPALSWESKIKKKLRIATPCLGKFRPAVGQCCHRCTPDSLRKKLSHGSSLGFHDLLSISETQTRYRGWLVRRVCCALFVSGCKVHPSAARNRLERVLQSNRVKDALTTEHGPPEGADGQGQPHRRLALLRPLINTCISSCLLRFVGWAMLKMLTVVFGSVQVNLNHLSALRRASQEGSLLVYVHARQSIVDCALVPLILLCHNLRVPYTFCPFQIGSSSLRSTLQRVGVVLLPPSAGSEREAEMDSLYSPVMISLVRELLHEGQALTVSVSAQSGQGGQWLARIRQLIEEGSVPDVCLVPVGISYDCMPGTDIQGGLRCVLQWLKSLLWSGPRGSVRVHFAQPFSLKEMWESGGCRVDKWLPLQDLLLPIILNTSKSCVFGQRQMSWLLPVSHPTADLEEAEGRDRDLSIAISLHLIFSTTTCMAVMSTSLVSSLLLYRHCKGVSLSVLCSDVVWLTEELLFRNRDVGFGGTLVEVVHYSLSLLAPHLIIAAVPSRKDPLIVPRPSPAATLHLSLQAQAVKHTFILEAVGACAVSAMLREVAVSGISSPVRRNDGVEGEEGEEVKGDVEFDVVLCQTELTERALQLCHLLPPGFMPPCQSSHSFALDAVDSLIRCGILIMEEIPSDMPVCDFWKREGTLSWTTSDDPYKSDSDCEEQELRSYKISQPRRCPDMFFFLCNLLAGHLRALCWTTAALEHVDAHLPEAEFVAQIHSRLHDAANAKKQHYESCSEEAVHTAVRTLIDLGVLSEERRRGGVSLGVRPLFQLSANREKLQRFISHYLYN